MPASTATLKVYLGLDPATVQDDQAMGAAVEASNDYCQNKRPDLCLDHDTGLPLASWPPRIEQAALVEAARLYGRRGSSLGLAAFQDTGVAYLPGTDPEVKALLELGEHQKSVVS